MLLKFISHGDNTKYKNSKNKNTIHNAFEISKS